MSKEEIIRQWKKGEDILEQAPARALESPIGEQELSDEELEVVEGGALDTRDYTFYSCWSQCCAGN